VKFGEDRSGSLHSEVIGLQGDR